MDRSLATFLRSLQASSSHDDAIRLLPTATSLLQRLSNPLNIALLSSQLLSNPNFFSQQSSIPASRQIFSVFYTAAVRVVAAEEKQDAHVPKSNLSRQAWTKAVIQGADDKSPRWRHLLLIAGLLLGFEGQGNRQLPLDLRKKLESALVTASNLALENRGEREPDGYLAVVWTLNAAFPFISDYHRSALNYDLLLPVAVQAAFFSREGLDHGYWLGAVDQDIRQVANNRFNWSLRSPTGVKIQAVRSSGLVSSLGPLARMIAHAVENVANTQSILVMVDRLLEFARNLALSWRQNKLSEIDQSEEADFLDSETLNTALPVLLHILRDSLFAIVICLRAVLSRLLVDYQMSLNNSASATAIKCLHIFRDTYFIAHRFGQTSSSQYTFVNLTSIDILNQYPTQAEAFLASIRPASSNQIPTHPLERLHDLYFLNLAEQFTLTLTPPASETLVLNAALPYITPSGDKRLNEIYEAAHSVLLAVFTVPQNASIAAQQLPFYIETLLQSFPVTLTSRQFRLAVKSVQQISAPPSAITTTMPNLQSTILEMLHYKSNEASELVIPAEDASTGPALSEKAVLVLAMIESLPFLSVPILEESLYLTAEQLLKIANMNQRSLCQRRFWELLHNGDMDVERAAICVAWWSSRGGRELVVHGELPDDEYTMSGGIQDS